MILQALNELCDREKLLGENPHYEMKRVPWIIHVGKNGEFLGMIDNRQQVTVPSRSTKGKARVEYRARYRWVPREPERTSGDYAFFLCDTSEYLFALEAPAKKGPKRPQEKLENRRKLFREKIRHCRDQTHDEAIEALLVLLDHAAGDPSQVKLDDECSASDLITFLYALDVDLLIGDRPKVRAYWTDLRQREIRTQPLVDCLVTGRRDHRATKHPMLKKVPGGTTSGVALVSFNAPAFESYGLDGNENAPVAQSASEKCTTALNRLLNPSAPNPFNTDETLDQRCYRISADTVVCYWAAKDKGQSFCDQFAPILEANPDDVQEMYHSIWLGNPPSGLDTSAFFALTLSGTQGRAVVRDWFESTVRDVAGNIARYFSDLNLVRNTPKPKTLKLPPQLPLTILLRSLAPFGRSDEVPAHVAAQMVHAALSGKRYPFTVLHRALERMRAEIGDQGWSGLERRDARAALIKALLIRNYHREVEHEMNPSNTNPGYTLGRLMAVLERIQQEALGDINATVIDRYFSGASGAPKSVFVRLLKNARNHVRKAKDDSSKSGIIFLLDKLLDELSIRFDPGDNGFPAHLSLEDQGLFVIGYHHMRHWLWMTKEERKKWESAHNNLPRAYLWTKVENTLQKERTSQ